VERDQRGGARAAGAVRAPRFPANIGPWLNGPPLAGWRGAVTLVDFWTYSCINCLRTLPALRAWHATYAPAGLTSIGIHTPEFPFEHEPDNVARALRELGVAYPVVLDNERAFWGAFANRAWPHRYLIDRAGRIVHDHAGEGGEAATERAIRAALATDGRVLPAPVFLAPDGEPLTAALAVDDAPGAVCLPGSPELFAGYYRGVSGNAGGFREDVAFDYTDPGDEREGYINLTGRWLVDADAAHFVGPGTGSLRVAFRGTAPNIVLAPIGDLPVQVEVTLAGEPPVRPTSTPLVVDAPRLYRLPPAAWRLLGACDGLRTLTIVPQGPGLAVYSFTFAACG
jgi:thiol-disulfide isomerase/thioredoxin